MSLHTTSVYTICILLILECIQDTGNVEENNTDSKRLFVKLSDTDRPLVIKIKSIIQQIIDTYRIPKEKDLGDVILDACAVGDETAVTLLSCELKVQIERVWVELFTDPEKYHAIIVSLTPFIQLGVGEGVPEHTNGESFPGTQGFL